jgi:hypothetical protein
MKFAMLEMKVTLSSLLRKYQLLPANPQRHLDLTVVIVLQSLTGVVLRIQPRGNQPAHTSENDTSRSAAVGYNQVMKDLPEQTKMRWEMAADRNLPGVFE